MATQTVQTDSVRENSEVDQWNRALATYQEKRAASDEIPIDADGCDEAVDSYCEAMAQLVETVPAPDLYAVIKKLELERFEGFALPEAVAKAVMADLRQLADEQQKAHQAALAPVAAAWIDRWRALGGSFGCIYNADMTERGLNRGIPMSYVWEPPSYEEAQAHSPTLRPHEMILRREDFDGAHKMLESMLTLIPGLQDAVHAVASDLVDEGRGHADPDLIRRFLERRGFYLPTDKEVQ